MRILIGHNYYQTRGGEDAVVRSECDLLKSYGHDVVLYERSNEELDTLSVWQKFRHLMSLDWSPRTHRDFKSLIKKFQPDVVHLHNIFFMITPSVYFACREAGIPVVQTQHNFRLMCSNALFYRDNMVCEDCLKKSLWQGVYHRCYRNSFFLTASLVNMLRKHWKKRTWIDLIDVHIALSEFSRQKFIQAGIPEAKIVVKPNFTQQSVLPRSQNQGYALYIGRLSVEKGVKILLEAWQSIKHIPLKIIGEGPLAAEFKAYAQLHNLSNVEFLGHCSPEKCQEYMKAAKFLVVPSQCYENFPRVIAEAFSCGVPVVASRLGSLAEIIEDGTTGILFDPKQAASLIEKIHWAVEHSEDLMRMGLHAHRVFEERYTAEQNYHQLMKIYQKAIESS